MTTLLTNVISELNEHLAISDFDNLENAVEIEALPLQLSLTRDRIHFLDRPSQLHLLANIVKQCSIVAIDTETRSDFQTRGHKHPVAILQIAAFEESSGQEHVFILDLLSLNPHDYDSYLCDIFLSNSILKIGHDLCNDLMDLRRCYGQTKCFNVVQNVLEINELHSVILDEIRFDSLAKLTAVYLNARLDKSQQRSNWAKRPLTKKQLTYATLDVSVLILLYHVLMSKIKKSFQLESVIITIDSVVNPKSDCPNCLKKFSRPSLRMHLKNSSCRDGATGCQLGCCSLCSKSFKCYTDFLHYYNSNVCKIQTEGSTFCYSCMKIFASVRYLRHHQSGSSCSNFFKLICKVCGALKPKTQPKNTLSASTHSIPLVNLVQQSLESNIETDKKLNHNASTDRKLSTVLQVNTVTTDTEKIQKNCHSKKNLSLHLIDSVQLSLESTKETDKKINLKSYTVATNKENIQKDCQSKKTYRLHKVDSVKKFIESNKETEEKSSIRKRNRKASTVLQVNTVAADKEDIVKKRPWKKTHRLHKVDSVQKSLESNKETEGKSPIKRSNRKASRELQVKTVATDKENIRETCQRKKVQASLIVKKNLQEPTKRRENSKITNEKTNL